MLRGVLLALFTHPLLCTPLHVQIDGCVMFNIIIPGVAKKKYFNYKETQTNVQYIICFFLILK